MAENFPGQMKYRNLQSQAQGIPSRLNKKECSERPYTETLDHERQKIEDLKNIINQLDQLTFIDCSTQNRRIFMLFKYMWKVH